MGLTTVWDEGQPLHTTELVYLHGSVAPMQPAMLRGSPPALTPNSSPSKAVFLNVLCREASPVVPCSWSSMYREAWGKDASWGLASPVWSWFCKQPLEWHWPSPFHFLFSVYTTYGMTLRLLLFIYLQQGIKKYSFPLCHFDFCIHTLLGLNCDLPVLV